jgi:hypothetical protein
MHYFVAVPLQKKFATYIYTYVHTRFGDSLVVRSGYELAALVEEGHGVAGLQVVVVFLAHLARPRVPLINLIHTHTHKHTQRNPKSSQSIRRPVIGSEYLLRQVQW